jgi:hypothetical protein
MWRNTHRFDISPSPQYNENVLRELIFLYVAKLMELYLKIYVSHYKKTATDQSSFIRYEEVIDSLDLLSTELWFFDSKPTPFDIQYSNSIRPYNLMKTNEGFYYKNPLYRLKIMREFS